MIPFALVGTAGTTDHGAIDDLESLAAIARDYNLWFHVDGAYGGALIFSGQKDRLKGIEQADSITVDFHKLFYQPISCGGLLLKDRQNFRFLLHHADYLNRETDTLPNLVEKSLATTKRFDALKLMMSMQTLGTAQLGAMYEHLLELTQHVADLVTETDELELQTRPQLSTVLFRYTGTLAAADIDDFNRKLRLDLLTSGQAVLGETVINDQVYLKLTLLNPCLKLNDLKSLFAKIISFAGQYDDNNTAL